MRLICVNGANLRLFHRQFGGGRVEILFRDRLRFGQRLLTRQGHLGKITFRQRLRTLCAQLHQRGFHFPDLVFSLFRVDNAEQLPLFHLIANLNGQRF